MSCSRSMNRGIRRLGPAVLILLAVACVPLRRTAGPPPAFIIFRNESLDQAAVYVVTPGVEFRRIGTVFPGRTDTLTVPADIAFRAGTVNIVARLLARSELPQTGPVSIRPGEQYLLTLPLNSRLISFLPTGS